MLKARKKGLTRSYKTLELDRKLMGQGRLKSLRSIRKTLTRYSSSSYNPIEVGY